VRRLFGVVLLVCAAAIASPLQAQSLFNPSLSSQHPALRSFSKPKPCLLHEEHFSTCANRTVYSCTKKVVGTSSDCHFETTCFESARLLQCPPPGASDSSIGSIGRAGAAGSGMPVP
jgi:hypothetical protein